MTGIQRKKCIAASVSIMLSVSCGGRAVVCNTAVAAAVLCNLDRVCNTTVEAAAAIQ